MVRALELVDAGEVSAPGRSGAMAVDLMDSFVVVGEVHHAGHALAGDFQAGRWVGSTVGNKVGH